MWFKNLLIYRINTWDVSPSELESALSKFALQKCLSMEMSSRGWLPPKEDTDAYVHLLGKQMLIAFGVEKKLLPSTVISQFSKSRVTEIEEHQGYKPARKQLKEIKEAVISELLPRAFAIRRKTYAWIDPVNGWLIVDSPNIVKADELLESLHKACNKFSLKFIKTQLSPSVAMTNWLSGDATTSFSVDRDCELRSSGENQATVRYVRHSLDSEELIRQIKAGKDVVKLALTWRDRISFILDEKLQLKRIAPLEFLKDQTELLDEIDIFDSDFTIMSGELMQLISDLISELHGLVQP